MKTSSKVLIGVGVVVVGIVVAASLTGSPTTAAATATTAAAAADSGPTEEYCDMSSDGGTFVLKVDSAATHDFSVCAGGKTDTSFNLDTSLSSGWDRRCTTETSADVEAVDAAVAVYSSGKRVDVAAAKAYCSSQHWGNS